MSKEPDYREMYLKMVRASENAINILIEAQRVCEEMYISSGEKSSELLVDSRDTL